MKRHIFRSVLLLLAAGSLASAQSASYTNFIRQIQASSGVQWQLDTVATTGAQWSPQSVDSGGASFELWTVMTSPLTQSLTSYQLKSCFVGTYGPVASVTMHSEDPYGPIFRTRADRPFSVVITVNGLLSGLTDPAAAKSINLCHYVQSYGVGGTGVALDRSQAILSSQASITQNGSQTLSYALTSIPGSNRSKVRGEETYSVFSLADYQVPAAQLASSYIQIWPVADGSFSGITQGQLIRFVMPQLTIALNDLYPNSTTYVQTYQGSPQLGMVGTTLPGSALVINDCIPQSRVLTLKGYDAVFSSDGTWTMELLTVTPFGTDRLAYVSFNINRTINVNSTLTTDE